MQKIVIDTNVFISSLIQRGYSYYIVSTLLSSSDIKICVSEEVFEEYYDVLNRKRFSKYPGFTIKAQSLIASIKQQALIYS